MISWLFHILLSAKNFQLTDTKRFDELKFRYENFYFSILWHKYSKNSRENQVLCSTKWFAKICSYMQSYCKTSMPMGFIFTKNIETIYIFHLIAEFHSLALRKNEPFWRNSFRERVKSFFSTLRIRNFSQFT